MNNILTNLMRDWDFLYNECEFRFIDSHNVEDSMGDAYLVLESPKLRVKFVLDRGPIFVEVQSPEETTTWHSIDLVRQLVTGKVQRSAFMDKDNAVFLRTNLTAVVAAFSPDRISETLKRINELKDERAKRLFG